MEKVTPDHNKKGAIIGVGNILQKDDGIGVKVLKYLEAYYTFPDTVTLIDGGTAGVGLQSMILGKDWLLIIDALVTAGNPGDIRLLAGEELLSRPGDLKMSPHQVGFFDLIQLMELNGEGAETFSILGIIPKDTGVGTDISPEVEASMDTAVSQVVAWLEKKAVYPKPVKGAVTPDYWWIR